MPCGRAVFVALALMGLTASAQAQVGLSVTAGLFSDYVWRGLSLTNKPVLQPDVSLSFTAGKATITGGGWANIELGRYDGANDIGEGGGLGSFDLTEFDPYAEVSVPVGKATLTGGVIGYIYPNDAGLTSDANTVELYGTVAFDVPLAPTFGIWYDVDKIKGAYLEAGVTHSLPVTPSIALDLGALAGFSAGQGTSTDPNESLNFNDDGLTHLDFSVGTTFAAGSVSIAPMVHLIYNNDDFTRITGATSDSDFKAWFGVSIGWSRSFPQEKEEAAAVE
jgi:uncharacterized protein (TIGR02001 family)